MGGEGVAGQVSFQTPPQTSVFTRTVSSHLMLWIGFCSLKRNDIGQKPLLHRLIDRNEREVSTASHQCYNVERNDVI